MNTIPSRGLFVTGTGTEVGKTYVTALIARNLVAAGKKVGVYKPAASSCIAEEGQLISEDACTLWTAAGQPGTLGAVCPQLFAAPLAPHRAAEAEGRQIDTTLLRSGLSYWGPQGESPCDIVLVEGAGGLMSPISIDDYNLDLAVEFGYPLVVVAPNALGVINDALQTLVTASTGGEGLEVAGVVLNHLQPTDDESAQTNRAELESRCVPPVLGEVSYQATSFDQEIDWFVLSDLVNLNKLA